MKIPNSDCPRKNWKLFGCKFEPRHSTTENLVPLTKLSGGNPKEVAELVESLKTRTVTYVCEVCVRCGRKA